MTSAVTAQKIPRRVAPRARKMPVRVRRRGHGKGNRVINKENSHEKHQNGKGGKAGFKGTGQSPDGPVPLAGLYQNLAGPQNGSHPVFLIRGLKDQIDAGDAVSHVQNLLGQTDVSQDQAVGHPVPGLHEGADRHSHCRLPQHQGQNVPFGQAVAPCNSPGEDDSPPLEKGLPQPLGRRTCRGTQRPELAFGKGINPHEGQAAVSQFLSLNRAGDHRGAFVDPGLGPDAREQGLGQGKITAQDLVGGPGGEGGGGQLKGLAHTGPGNINGHHPGHP